MEPIAALQVVLRPGLPSQTGHFPMLNPKSIVVSRGLAGEPKCLKHHFPQQFPVWYGPLKNSPPVLFGHRSFEELP